MDQTWLLKQLSLYSLEGSHRVLGLGDISAGLHNEAPGPQTVTSPL